MQIYSITYDVSLWPPTYTRIKLQILGDHRNNLFSMGIECIAKQIKHYKTN